MDEIRVLQVCQFYYPWVKSSSTGKFAYKISKYLSAHKVQVGLVTTDYHSNIKIKNCFQIFAEDEFKKYIFHVPKIFDRLNLCCSYCFNHLEKIIVNYDIIHVHEYLTPLNLYIIRLAWKYRIPYVIQPHGNVSFVYQFKDRAFHYRTLRMMLDRTLGLKILSSSKAVLAMSDYEKNLLESLGMDAEIYKVYNAIDPDEFEHELNESFFRNQLGIGRDEFIILYIGRKVAVKRLDLLIKALKKLLDEYRVDKKIRLIIAGPGEEKYEDYLRELIVKLGLEKNVIFLGPLYDKQKIAAFRSANLFVLVSKYEAFPTVMLEAFLYKVPVMITRVGVAAENVFSDKVILLSPNPTPHEIAEKIYEVIEGKYELRSIAEKSYSFLLRNLTYKKAVSRIIQIYKNIL